MSTRPPVSGGTRPTTAGSWRSATRENAGSRAHKLAVLREGVSTYALSLLVGTFLLWTFRTLDSGTGVVSAAYAMIAIGFVTSLGAAAAELLI